MIIEASRNRYGEVVTVEKNGSSVVMRVGRSLDIQSAYPAPDGMYYDSVKMSPEKGSLLVLGVAGGSAGHVGAAAGFKKIVGMDADPELIRLGAAHFHTEYVFDKIVIGDVYNFEDWLKLNWNAAYDCIFFDAYNAHKLSVRATENTFLRFMVSRLTQKGVLMFNCPRPASVQSLTIALRDVGMKAIWNRYGNNMVAFIKKP
jgi:spermidine synthase